MKAYAISLKKSEERRSYIVKHLDGLSLDYQIIGAVDGATLSNEELVAECDMEQVNKFRWWLTNGAIGCALSHYNAYLAFINSGQESALIVEDDVVLPDNIKEILNDIAVEIEPNEIILLYYTSFQPCKLSRVAMKELRDVSLVYPIDIKLPITATAYVIGKKAAQNLIDKIKPIRVTADLWSYFYQERCFDSFRLIYPSLISTKNFKSSIDYINASSLKAKLSNLVDRYRLPGAYQLLKLLRKRRLDSMIHHFSLTDEISPIYQKKIELMSNTNVST